MKITRLRREVYEMLIGGSYAADIAKRKHLSHQSVLYQVNALERGGFIKKSGERKSYPQFYERGVKAAVFEEAASRLTEESKRTESNGKGVSTKQKSHSRTHAKGCVITLVNRVGELSSFPTDDGTFRLFPAGPYNTQHGNEFFKSRILVDGREITVQFQRTEKGTMLFYVWPPEVEQTAGELSYQPAAWKELNEHVLNILSKYGGWRFGPTRSFSGATHFAVSEDAWFDRSTGILESETTNLRKAWLWLNVDQLEDELRAKMDSVEKYAEAVEEQSATKIGNVLHAVNRLADGQRPLVKKRGGDWHDDICYR
jgi:DNA-binding transcriptional ArsR family regulator